MIEHRNDLSLIFERAEIRVLITDHCARRHDFELGYDRCEHCMVLRAHLANAIIEWRDGCELLAASQEWQPIATAPKDGLAMCAWDGGWRSIVDLRTLMLMRPAPTHWMPLPAAPVSPAQQEPNHV